MFQEVASGVYAVYNRFVEGKAGIVVGSHGALALDACNYADEGASMAAFIREQGFPVDRLALTHGHGDHILGADAFVGAQIIAQITTPQVIERQVEGWANRWDVSPADARARVIHPNFVFETRAELDLGDKHVQLFATPGHSEDGVCALVVEDRVLFAGDTVVTGIVPAFGDGDSRVLERTLYRLASLDIEVLVSGHGPVMRGHDVIRRWLTDTAAYLAEVRYLVRQGLARGQSLDGIDDILEAIPFERLVGERLPRDAHNMTKRHANVVAKIVQECARGDLLLAEPTE